MYYAKPVKGYEGSYKYHVEKCIEIFKYEIEKNKKVLENIMESIDYSFKLFKKNCYIAVAMHDIGKLTETFQNQMKKTINSEPNIDYFRHEIISYVYMILAVQNYIKQNKKEFPYYLYAVLSHHKKLEINLSQFQREKSKAREWPKLTNKEYSYAINLVHKFSEDKLDLIDDISNFEINKNAVLKYFEYYATESFLVQSKLKRGSIRTLYSLCKGLLQYCDWTASSGKEPLVQPINQSQMYTKVKTKVESEGRQYVRRKFHDRCAMTINDVIAIAPTGSGKTEAALLWATNSAKSKIIFLMPTMVTSNSIYERLKNYYFGKKYCGLTHSSSDTYFAANEDIDVANNPELRFELLKYNAFIPPVMVSTVDQLLISGFNLGHWCLKEYALVGSSVIFDEIQAYDTFTLALITETIKKIKKLQGRIMIMSATMPNFLLDHFSKLLDIDVPIVATELMSRKLNHWRFIDKQIEDMLDMVKSYLDRGKKVAIIVNNIEKAKELYATMAQEYKTLCLHSEFTMKDRTEKERLLEEKNDFDLVITTQVMEVSLDISFHTIFSECAPIDNLVQRAGRCNRRGEYKDSEFIVFDHSEVSEKYVYNRYKNILIKTKKVVQKNQRLLSEKNIQNMINEVYDGYILYDASYHEAKHLYEKIEKEEIIFDLMYDEERLKTRIIDNEKVSIIPYRYKKTVEDLFSQKKYLEICLYEVPVNRNKFRRFIKDKYSRNEFNLPIYAIDYDSDIGIIYDK